MKKKLAYEIGITKMPWRDRLAIVWRILRKQTVTFQVTSSETFHRNHTQQITEIEL